MKPRTVQHLQKGAANARLAHRLAGESPPSDWAIVVGFYAAVHYVGAVLWEQAEYVPRNHDDRSLTIHRTQELRRVEDVYDRLKDLSWKVRYLPAAQISQARIQSALGDMAEIQSVVLSTLDVP